MSQMMHESTTHLLYLLTLLLRSMRNNENVLAYTDAQTCSEAGLLSANLCFTDAYTNPCREIVNPYPRIALPDNLYTLF